MRLEDRVAIVTGGGKGIGRHYVLGLAREGAAVVVAELDAAAAEATAAEARAQGGTALAVPTDVSDPASVSAMVEQTTASYGRVDVLVNNAAIFASVHFERVPHDRIGVEEWDRMFAVNVRGVWLCCKAVIPHMRARGYGKIVNIASSTAWTGNANMLHYVASKAAVAGLSRALAREVAPDGILVNSIAPGYTESDTLLAVTTPDRREIAINTRLIPRAERPEDLVGTVVFLASHDSDFITGQTILVDGGLVLT
jgi:3-oxoacyl-[acyl-carrier protein] reductase